MSRIARVIGVAAVAASALSVVPAEATAQILCRRDRTIYTSDMTITYPWWEICR